MLPGAATGGDADETVAASALSLFLLKMLPMRLRLGAGWSVSGTALLWPSDGC
jgi:hypothetical protein